MEEIKYYITKINNLLYKIETTNQNYLKHFYQYRLHIYLNKLHDQVELTIPYVDGNETSEDEDDDVSL